MVWYWDFFINRIRVKQGNYRKGRISGITGTKDLIVIRIPLIDRMYMYTQTNICCIAGRFFTI